MASEFDRALGRRLRQRRRLLGLSQAEVGALCGVRFQQIQKYECAANRVSAEVLWKLSCALGVEVGYFFAGLAQGGRAEARSWRAHPEGIGGLDLEEVGQAAKRGDQRARGGR